jgi:hypothetical protein
MLCHSKSCANFQGIRDGFGCGSCYRWTDGDCRPIKKKDGEGYIRSKYEPIPVIAKARPRRRKTEINLYEVSYVLRKNPKRTETALFSEKEAAENFMKEISRKEECLDSSLNEECRLIKF